MGYSKMSNVKKPLKNKIRIIVLPILAILLAVFGCISYIIVSYKEVITSYTDEYYRIALVSGSMDKFEISLKDYIRYGSEEYYDELEADYKTFYHKFSNLYYDRFEYDQSIRYEIENISILLGRIDTSMKKITNDPDSETAEQVYNDDISIYLAESRGIVADILDTQVEISNSTYASVSGGSFVCMVFMSVSLVGFILMVVYLFVFVHFRITRPIQEIEEWAEMFRDDYCQMSPLKFNKEDEIQQISESFNIVRDKMRESQKNNEELNEALTKLRKEEEYKKKFVQLLYEEKREKDNISSVAQHDGLTGLYNRRTFDDFVNEFIVRRPGNKDGALFLIDMDNFKGVNDSLGHLQGDEALKTLAGAMRVVFSGGYLGRYGGDEFIAFIVGCTTETDMERYAGELCRKMHKKLEYNGKTVQLSVSIGAASSVGVKACSELYMRADKALYHSKENGRNRYTVFTDALQKSE